MVRRISACRLSLVANSQLGFWSRKRELRTPTAPSPVLRRTGLDRLSGLGARERFARVETSASTTSQRHRAELEARQRVRQHMLAHTTGGAPPWRGSCGASTRSAALSEPLYCARSPSRSRERPPDDFRSRPQSRLFHLRGALALSAVAPDIRGGHDARPIFPASRLPRRHNQSRAACAQPRDGSPLRDPYAAGCGSTRPRSFALGHELGGDRFLDVLVEDTHPAISATARIATTGATVAACPACRVAGRRFCKWKSAPMMTTEIRRRARNRIFSSCSAYHAVGQLAHRSCWDGMARRGGRVSFRCAGMMALRAC